MVEPTCQICNGSLKIDHIIMHKALKCLLDTKSQIYQVWTDNAFGHIVWKMAGYNKLRNEMTRDFLNPFNLMFQLKQAYEREFLKVRSSFFQQVVEKDEFAARHFIGVVAAIRH